MATDRELFELRSGRIIMDEDLSEKMYVIKAYHPERADETSSGFEWSEMGMANLFGMLYNKEARYCREHKSWYTYFEGAWRKARGTAKAELVRQVEYQKRQESEKLLSMLYNIKYSVERIDKRELRIWRQLRDLLGIRVEEE